MFLATIGRVHYPRHISAEFKIFQNLGSARRTDTNQFTEVFDRIGPIKEESAKTMHFVDAQLDACGDVPIDAPATTRQMKQFRSKFRRNPQIGMTRAPLHTVFISNNCAMATIEQMHLKTPMFLKCADENPYSC
jgi:hypothetical protein